MKIQIPSKGVLGNSEQLIENILFDVKLTKLKHYHLANGNTVAEVGDSSSDVSQTCNLYLNGNCLTFRFCWHKFWIYNFRPQKILTSLRCFSFIFVIEWMSEVFGIS